MQHTLTQSFPCPCLQSVPTLTADLGGGETRGVGGVEEVGRGGCIDMYYPCGGRVCCNAGDSLSGDAVGWGERGFGGVCRFRRVVGLEGLIG